MTISNLAAAEHRGISAAVTPLPGDAAHLTDQQRDYLDQVEMLEREILERRRRAHGLDGALALPLLDRLVHRSVRSTVATRLADALAVGDDRSVATFLPVYLVALAREESTRPRASA